MSQQVDSRIVEMRFDNAGFEEKIQATLLSLEKLNKRLDNIDAGKGLETIQNGLSRFDANPANKAVDTLASRFSNLGIVGMTVIQNLTNKMTDFATNTMGKAISGLVSGGWQRSLNMSQAKFQMAGLMTDIKDINKREEAVQNMINNGILPAVQGTFYSLDQAALVASRLMASGITDASKMKDYLRGVAGVAAMTNSSFADIGDVFTNVAGNGKLMTMELRRLEARGLNVAAALGKQWGKSEEEVRDMVSKGQVDFKMFADAMNDAFGDHAQESLKLFTGAVEDVKAALARFGEKFASPMQLAFRDILNNITPIIDDIATLSGPFIQKSANAWAKIGSTVSNVLKTIWMAMDEIIRTFKPVDEWPDRIAESTTASRALAKVFLSIKNLVSPIIKIVGGVFNVLSAALKGLAPLFNALIMAINKKGSIFSSLAKDGIFITKAFDALAKGVEKATESLSALLIKIGSGVSPFISKIAESFGKLADSATKMGSAFAKNGGYIAIISTIGSLSVAKTISRISAFFSQGEGPVLGLVKSIKDIKVLLDNISAVVKYDVSVALEKLSLALQLMSANVRADTLMKIAEAVGILALSMMLMSTVDIPHLAASLVAIEALMFGLTKALQSLELKGSLTAIMNLNSVAFAIRTFAIAIAILAVSVRLLGGMDLEQLMTGLIGVFSLLIGLSTLMRDFSGTKVEKFMKGVGGLILVAVAVRVLVKAVKELGSLQLAELGKGLGSVAALVGSLVAFSNFAKSINIRTGLALIAMAESVRILADAVGVFGSMDSNALVKGLKAFTAIMLEMMLLLPILQSVGGGKSIASAAGLFILANAVSVLGDVLMTLSSGNAKNMGQSLMLLALGLGEMALAANLMKGSIGGAAAMVVMAAGIGLLVPALKGLASIGLAELLNGLVGLAAVFTVLGAATLVLSPVVPMLLALGAGVALLGVGVFALGAGLTSIGVALNTFNVAIAGCANGVWTVLSGLGERIKMLGSFLVDGLKVIFNSLIEALPVIGNFVVELVKTLGSKLIENLPAIMSAGKTIILGLLKGFEENIPFFIQKGFDITLAVINGLADGVRNNAEAVRDAAINLGTALIDALKIFLGIHSPSTVAMEIGLNFVLGLINGLKSMPGAIKSAALKLGTTVLNGLKKIGGFAQVGISKLKDFVSGIISQKSSAASKAETIASAVKSGLGKIDLKNAGVQAIRGFVNGLGSMMDKVREKAAEIGKETLNKIKEKLGIHSPSREMAKLGNFATQGFINGVGDKMSRVRDSGESLGKAMLDAMQNAVGNASDITDIFDTDLDPVITPIMDLSRVNTGVNAIDAMLSRQQAMSISANVASARTMYDGVQEIVNGVKDAFNEAISTQAAIDGNKTYTFIAPTTLNGREIARASATYTQAELDKIQVRTNRTMGII